MNSQSSDILKILIKTPFLSFITDLSGEAVQHLQYLPFGESFVSQTSSSWQTRYTFSGKPACRSLSFGKEKDEEIKR
jgi:hypothetical protein